MIPRHRPPFGLLSLLKHRLSSVRSGDVAPLEQRCAAQLDVRQAVWLPSARYGICKSIQHTLSDRAAVYGPAFTCKVVHKAIRRSGRPMNLLDCAPHSSLMYVKSVDDTEVGHGIVLSEVFGHRYCRELQRPLIHNAALRIFDMAMAIPNPADLARLRDRDVAVVSFGLGKALYAGWGAMAFTNEDSVAAFLRDSREADLTDPSFLRTVIQETEVALRTAAHQRWVYGWLRKRSEQQLRGQEPLLPVKGSKSATVVPPPDSRLLTGKSREWWHRPSRLTTALTADNFRHASAFDGRRQELAEVYRRQLGPVAGEFVQLPSEEPHGLSHFSIRTSPVDRDGLRQHLWARGIDTATLFPFPPGCHPQDYPATAQLCREIINLPLSHQLSCEQVTRICDAIKDFRFAVETHQAAA